MTVHRNVPLLAGAQALYWCGQVIAIIVAALVGQTLAPHRLLATLPLACITLGNIAVTRTLSRIMHERGRRAGFALGIAGRADRRRPQRRRDRVGELSILPLIVVAGFMNLALLRRQRATALPAPA
jgi:hypothetical protein